MKNQKILHWFVSLELIEKNFELSSLTLEKLLHKGNNNKCRLRFSVVTHT
jgi:hypothetical protein